MMNNLVKRRKQRNKKTGDYVLPQTLTAGLGGPQALRQTSTVRTMDIREIDLKASGTAGDSRPTEIAFTLNELYPMPENDDKFSEYKIQRVDIALIGFAGLDPVEYPSTTMIIAPNPDERRAGTIPELLRQYGVRVCPILACQNSVVNLITVFPRFDETGSANHYVTGFLQVGGGGQNVEWYGATVAVQGPQKSTTILWKVKLLYKTTLVFRGRQ